VIAAVRPTLVSDPIAIRRDIDLGNRTDIGLPAADLLEEERRERDKRLG